jgi:hypothetical protein
VEWFFLLIGVVIFFGPIVWALTVGRKAGAPENDDAKGSTAYASFIRKVLTGGRGGG